MLCGPKCDAMLHDVLGKWAMGVPQLAVLTLVAPLRTSLGVLVCRGQNQTFTPELERSIAKKPPPFELKFTPNEFDLVSSTEQPALPVASTSQFVPTDVPVMDREPPTVQPVMTAGE